MGHNRAMRARFADCLFDSEMRTLSRRGEPVALSPKAFALLEILIAAAPAAVSKETLYERLWPDTYVEQGNLHNLVSEIRSAIGDGAREIIRTVHRFGYSFIGTKMTSDPIRFSVISGEEEIPLQEGANDIGRDAACAVVINAPDVSRRHARLTLAGNTITLEDLGSKNGTFIGKTAVTKASEVSDEDDIVIGRTHIRIRRVRKLRTTKTAL
jgi:DNA-binding winged helix-turn-helix (wHTH) protein